MTDESNTTGGDADNTATTVDKLHIFVGDSRTVGLSNAMGCVSYDKLLQIRTEENLTEYYLAEVGSGYSWYSTKALPKLVKMLNENPAATVILNHGINDLGNIDQYIASYQWLIRGYVLINISKIIDTMIQNHSRCRILIEHFHCIRIQNL